MIFPREAPNPIYLLYIFGFSTLVHCLNSNKSSSSSLSDFNESDNNKRIPQQSHSTKTAPDQDLASSKIAGDTFVEQTQCWQHDGTSTKVKTYDKTFDSLRDLFKCVKQVDVESKLNVLVTGGAGFVGSHLVDSLMLDGHRVFVVDNFFTGRKSNVEHWTGHPNFQLFEVDVENLFRFEQKIDQIYHLASPASPAHYLTNPIKTIRTNTIGTLNILELAKANAARIVLASTSEIYGDPEIHPQPESYWGHTNPIGPRSCYDESKRVGESMTVAYSSEENVSIGIARIFNTYGPRMHPNDGRVVSNFITQAISGSPLTVYGRGNQTRSFQYVSDLITGLRKLMASPNTTLPINLGNPQEMTIYSLAQKVLNLIPNSSSQIVFRDLPIDDPHRRQPDIRRASELLDWKPTISLENGLNKTINYFIRELNLLRKES